MKHFIFLLMQSIFIFLAFVWMNACKLDPLAWDAPTKPAFDGKYGLNQDLKSVEPISLAGWYGAEDMVFDEEGNLYTGVHKGEDDFSDGKILKISPSGKVEVFYHAGSWVAGLHFDKNKNLIALSHKEGLISISPSAEVRILADRDGQGRPFLIPNGLDIASDGKIYFSNTSSESAYDIKYGRKLILEMRPQGGLYQYNPQTGKVKTLIDGTYFGNGVVLSRDESFLLMTETTKYRVLRYGLKGANRGKTEIFMENLPGFPNGISIREDGSFWLGFTTRRNDALDNIHHKKGMKKFLYGLPAFLQPKADRFGMVMHVSEQGEVLNTMFDPDGEQVPEAGAVKEHKGYLYLGGDVVSHISRIFIGQD